MSKLAGSILLAIGILIAGTSGLCSLVAVYSMLNTAGGAGMLFLVLPFGGIPFVIGFGLYRWGRSILRRANTKIGDTFD